MDRIITYELSKGEREEILGRLGPLLEEHPEILFALAHGSFVEGGPFRDLDLAVYLATEIRDLGPTYEVRLEGELASTLGVSFPLDVRVMNQAPIPFRYHALRGRLLADRDAERRAEITAYVVSRYLDIRPVLEHFAREAFS